MGDVNFDNPYNSILDILFRYPKNTIIKELNNSVESWTYTKLNETKKIADQISEKIKQHDFS